MGVAISDRFATGLATLRPLATLDKRVAETWVSQLATGLRQV